MSLTLKRTLALVVGVSAGLGFLVVLLELFFQVSAEDVPLQPAPLVAAALAYGAYRIVNAGVWSAVLGAVGERTSFLKAAKIWLVAESARWCPGSVWGYAARTAIATRKDLNGSAVAASLVLELLLTLFAWAMAACIGLATLERVPDLAEIVPALPPEVPLGVLVPAAGVAVLGLLLLAGRRHPRVRSFTAKLATLRRMRVVPSQALAAWLAYVALCLAHGATFWLILGSLGLDVPLGAAVCANAIAWIVGFVAIFAPGGLGVREAAVALLLAPWTGLASAAFAAVLWRLVQVVIEPLVLAPIFIRAAQGREGRLYAHTREV